MGDETVLEVERLRKVYGHTVAVDDVSFSVRRGEIFGLLGSNGAGKTTTVEWPEIVFLDEMTTGLDPAARHVAWELIETIRDRGTTVVLVTHFMDGAERLCDRDAVVEAGRIVALDRPHGLIDRYGSGRTVVFTCPSVADGASGTAAEAAVTAAALELDWLSRVEQVRGVARRGSLCVVEGEGAVLATVAAALVGRGIVPDDLRVEESSLETVFLALTGHTVED